MLYNLNFNDEAYKTDKDRADRIITKIEEKISNNNKNKKKELNKDPIYRAARKAKEAHDILKAAKKTHRLSVNELADSPFNMSKQRLRAATKITDPGGLGYSEGQQEWVGHIDDANRYLFNVLNMLEDSPEYTKLPIADFNPRALITDEITQVLNLIDEIE